MEGAQRLMGMDERAWRRHANPWSAWTRILTPLPLLALAVWSRVWIGWWSSLAVAAVLLWVWWNPRAFPPPRSLGSWASRGVLGERAVIAHPDRVAPHHRRAMATLTALSAAGLPPLAWGLWALDPWAVASGVLLTAGAKTWFVDRCVWALGDLEREGVVDPQPGRADAVQPEGLKP